MHYMENEGTSCRSGKWKTEPNTNSFQIDYNYREIIKKKLLNLTENDNANMSPNTCMQKNGITTDDTFHEA